MIEMQYFMVCLDPHTLGEVRRSLQRCFAGVLHLQPHRAPSAEPRAKGRPKEHRLIGRGWCHRQMPKAEEKQRKALILSVLI